ncbi:sporulation protein [Mesobacillus maritimus]|uniref:sporulation protein n=1 Tax=Mesobacillus maritimus TaxID=1643336 RepID=UPI00203F21B1|nr:sporulation protein [Mesobacillus maritimus]MCM3587407.1 sporulation protein [Mesobacillus maritimus]MCM3667967.1 sporulation protein [Mesobacillus maritimus]
MLLRKYMSLLGIGSAQIDLVLEKDTYRAGETVKGVFHIKGGTIDQQLKRIECDLVRRDLLLEKDVVLHTATILTSSTIQADAVNEVLFSFKLPEDMEVSTETQSYRFSTRLYFTQGVASSDHDEIKVVTN